MALPSITTEAEAIELVSRLVGIASVSPGVDGGMGEGEVGEAVAEFAHAAGADVQQQEVMPQRFNVVCTLPAECNSGGLLLEAHMDTVALGPMKKGHEPWLDGQGRLHGRGACDTKGSLAAMLLTLRWAAQQKVRPCPLIVAATVDEEVGGAGADVLSKSGIVVRGAVVGEPTSLKVVRAHRGAGSWSLATLGRAAHSSLPERGDNAIYSMADLIGVLRTEFKRRLEGRTHPLTGPATFSIGAIQAGDSPNMIPNRCEIRFERRTVPGERLIEVETEIKEVLDSARKRHPCLQIELEGPLVVYDPLDTPEEAPIVRAVQASCQQVTGDATIAGATYGSDASVLSSVGIPSVLCGPGDIAYAHTADEWVPVAEVVQAAQIFASTWLNFSEVLAESTSA